MAVMTASALLLPSCHASGISSAINSPTAIGAGGGLSTADGASIPAGTGSPRIEAGPLVIHIEPWATACEIASSTWDGSQAGMGTMSSYPSIGTVTV